MTNQLDSRANLHGHMAAERDDADDDYAYAVWPRDWAEIGSLTPGIV